MSFCRDGSEALQQDQSVLAARSKNCPPLRLRKHQILNLLQLRNQGPYLTLRNKMSGPEQTENLYEVYRANVLFLTVSQRASVVAQQKSIPRSCESNRLTFSQIESLRITLQCRFFIGRQRNDFNLLGCNRMKNWLEIAPPFIQTCLEFVPDTWGDRELGSCEKLQQERQ